MKNYGHLFVGSLLFALLSGSASAQSSQPIDASSWYTQPGIIGTMVLAIIILIIFALISVARISKLLRTSEQINQKQLDNELQESIINLPSDEVDKLLEARKKGGQYKLKGDELSGLGPVQDKRGLVDKVTHNPDNPFVDEKKPGKINLQTDNRLIDLILAYLGAAAAWLVLGTLAGQYLGMKFVWPDIDHVAWLSFGRLRPVHTNTVFWGWASLAMIGLAYFVVTRTSNRKIYSYKWGWIAFYLINACVLLGNLALMNGINNGGGEYREYIWPIMSLFAIGLVLTLMNFYKTIATRNTKEIYVSNWFILGSLSWTIVLTVIGYLPFYQNGLGETVIQGYYMHQGVGMWFMTFTLGLVYYYLPSALNKPIYSYSLGVLAFWTQMLFYTLIGTHHFVFSPLPWWLQTVAIVFSGGMFIPVLASTINFLMTMRGSMKAIADSYVLPFLLVGVLFYFIGSAQGSFQAFRFTNYVWHFTDFNVAHSHLTMYGIICFLLWGSLYAIVPKLTRTEPNQLGVGMHFWFAFIGMIIYTFSLMIGGTEKGLSWIDQAPFMESVNLMAPYWVWRAVGGSLMFFSHLVFAWNLYRMTRGYIHLKRREKDKTSNKTVNKKEKDHYVQFS